MTLKPEDTTNSSKTSEEATHFEARAAWDYAKLDDRFSTKISGAIIRDDGKNISIDWPPSEGQTTQTLLTKKSGSRYSGRSIWASGTSQMKTAHVEAVLYSNELGHVLLGQEDWESGNTVWFVVQLIGKGQAG